MIATYYIVSQIVIIQLLVVLDIPRSPPGLRMRTPILNVASMIKYLAGRDPVIIWEHQ